MNLTGTESKIPRLSGIMKHGYTHKLKTSSKRHSPKIAIVYSMELLLFVASCLLTSSGSNELHGTRYTSFRTLGWVHFTVAFKTPKNVFFTFPTSVLIVSDLEDTYYFVNQGDYPGIRRELTTFLRTMKIHQFKMHLHFLYIKKSN